MIEKQAVANHLSGDDELSLADLWRIVLDGWRWLAGATLGGAIAAVVAIVVMPPKFEAVALVQVGHVGQVGQVDSRPVEPVSIAVERINSQEFQLRVAKAVGDAEWEEAIRTSVNGRRGRLQASELKKAPLIELKVMADSPKAAAAIAAAAITELKEVHDKLSEPLLKRMQNDLSIAKEKLLAAEAEKKRISQIVSAGTIRDERFTQLALMSSLLTQKEADIFAERKTVIAIETALSAPATQSARAIEPIYAAEEPVSPKKGLTMALGILGGMLLGMVLVFVRRSLKQDHR